MPTGEAAGEVMKGKPTPSTWRDTCDAYLRHAVEWLRHPPAQERKRGNPSPLAAQWLRFGAGRLIIDAARQEQSVSDRKAAELVARHIRMSAIVRSLTPDERKQLKIEEGMLRDDIKKFAERLRKGDTD